MMPVMQIRNIIGMFRKNKKKICHPASNELY